MSVDAGAPGSAPPAGPAHLHAVDVVRVLTIAGVVAVHATSLMMDPSSRLAGMVLTVLHVTREVFLFLSAFVLTYSCRGRPIRRRSWWRRRYRLVVVPYVAWTVIYLLADGSLTSPAGVVGRLARDLVTGGACFHLYFLLITFQLYALFPWLLERIRAHPRAERPLLIASAAFQLAFTAAIHYGLTLPAPVGSWLTHPGSWLPSYQLYVLAGVIAALHLEELTTWVRCHARAIVAVALAGAAAGLVSYQMDLRLLGMTPVHASEVFQPVVVVESAVAIAAQYLLGLWLAERLTARWRRRLEAGSDVSFGVFLAHPLVLQGLMAAVPLTGAAATLASLPPAFAVAAIVVVVVPATLLVTAGLVSLARRTPASLALTGRPTRPAALPAARPLPARAAG